MKLTLTFESDPENPMEAEQKIHTVLNAENWKLVVWEMNDYLRKLLKYSELPEKTAEEFEKIREHLNELLFEHHLFLD